MEVVLKASCPSGSGLTVASPWEAIHQEAFPLVIGLMEDCPLVASFEASPLVVDLLEAYPFEMDLTTAFP